MSEHAINTECRPENTPPRHILNLEQGSTPADWHRHSNGGGWVYRTALVEETAYVAPDAAVFGNAWVRENARVCGNARVFGSAKVFGRAKVFGSAMVFDNAEVSGSAEVLDNAFVAGNARVFGSAKVFGRAKVFGSAMVFGNAVVYGGARIFGIAKVCENAEVCDNARIGGNAQIGGHTRVEGDARDQRPRQGAGWGRLAAPPERAERRGQTMKQDKIVVWAEIIGLLMVFVIAYAFLLDDGSVGDVMDAVIMVIMVLGFFAVFIGGLIVIGDLGSRIQETRWSKWLQLKLRWLDWCCDDCWCCGHRDPGHLCRRPHGPASQNLED